MSTRTAEVLGAALEAARTRGIDRMIIASTTGRTALELCAMIDGADVRPVIVAHRAKPQGDEFQDAARKALAEKRIVLFRQTDRRALPRVLHRIIRKLTMSSWQAKLKAVKASQGTGICVCHKILWMMIQSGSLAPGEVVAVAGRKEGADSAGAFLIPGQKRWPVLLSVIIRPAPGEPS